MTRLEVAAKMFENPKRIARNKVGTLIYAEKNMDGEITI